MGSWIRSYFPTGILYMLHRLNSNFTYIYHIYLLVYHLCWSNGNLYRLKCTLEFFFILSVSKKREKKKVRINCSLILDTRSVLECACNFFSYKNTLNKVEGKRCDRSTVSESRSSNSTPWRPSSRIFYAVSLDCRLHLVSRMIWINILHVWYVIKDKNKIIKAGIRTWIYYYK